MKLEREEMQFDVLIVGAGPAGLSAAIKLAQLSKEQHHPLSICVLEKGSEVGAHLLSGAVLEPRALDRLIPDWQARKAPLNIPVKSDRFLFLTEKKSYRLPTPPQMKNHGNYIISLGHFCRWLAEEATALGVDIFPGFAAQSLLVESGRVIGVTTGDYGLDKASQPGPNFQAGIQIKAAITLLAEGCRGSLSEEVIKRFGLRNKSGPQTYAIGLKELWEIDKIKHRLGEVLHTVGWPLSNKTYGGSFLYHLDNHQVAIGLVIGLDYANPYLNPFEELQRLKLHPSLKPLFENGTRIAYGARALNEGGYQAIPKLSFPGGALIGCSAGFVNVAKIKGIHNAMESGLLAAENTFTHLKNGTPEKMDYTATFQQSTIVRELKSVRNLRPAFRAGLLSGLAYAAIDTYLLRGHAPWTFKHHADHLAFKSASNSLKIHYPKADGKITFDKLSSVYLTHTHHTENQPCHLQLRDPSLAIDVNYQLYASPETRYCPAGVYEIVMIDNKPRLQINAQNCIHCKTCDIADPKQNIHWTPPEGGSGPNYPNM